MLINKLIIQRFRGIPSKVEVDLSSPLTVLYAPNGTGKTSICDAVEWMLCGHVSRLGPSDIKDVRCQFGEDNLETFVEAHFSHQNKPYSLKRVLNSDGSVLQRRIGSGDYSPLRDKELFNLLVDALPPSNNSSKSQADWVRSTRFLESNSLSLLIDNDPESNETRKLIFSNLFGVGNYQKDEKNLDRLFNKLPAKRTINREKTNITKKISDYQESIKNFITEEGELYRNHVVNLLDEIAKNLETNVYIEKSLNLPELHKQLEIKFIQSQEFLESKKTSLIHIADNLHIFNANLSERKELETHLSKERDELTLLDTLTKSENIELNKKKELYQKFEEKISEITVTLEKLKSRKIETNRSFEIYKLPTIENETRENRLNKISDFISANEKKISEIIRKISLLDKCIELTISWVNEKNTLKGVTVELGSLQENYSSKNIILLAEQISEIKIKINTLKTSQEKEIGEIEVLLSSGKKYAETHLENSECPLCGQDHDNNLILQKKISDRFAKLSDKSKEEANLIAEQSRLVKLLEQENAKSKKLNDLVLYKNKLSQQIEDIEIQFINVGISKIDLDNGDNPILKLREIHEKHILEVKSLNVAVAPYKQSFDAHKILEEALEWLKTITTIWGEKLQHTNYTKPESYEDIKSSISKLESSLENYLILNKKAQAEELQTINDSVLNLNKSKTKSDEKKAVIASYEAKLALITREIGNFEKKWLSLSAESTINSQEIEKASSKIDSQNHIYNEVKGFFQKIEDYFVKIHEAEKQETQRGTYQKEISELERQLQEWISLDEAGTVIKNEIDAIQKEIRRFVAQEIEPLSEIINTLYLRAQGNKFINSIQADPSEKGILNWKINLDDKGETLNKILSLSQGQRQDLALAIFLARARSLGGTFFLDEPLAHLDDLNRVALLDTLRLIISEKNLATGTPHLVLTTASNNLLRHLREKFSLVEGSDGKPALRIYEMSGNPKVGIKINPAELVYSPNRLIEVASRVEI